MLEAELQAAVVDLARAQGWGISRPAAKALALEAEQYGVAVPPLEGLVYHPRYSQGSEPGWPDLTLIRRRDRRLVFAELKTEKGVVSPRQREVLDLLLSLAGPTWRAGDNLSPLVEVYVWRPSDLAAGTISDALR
jgi:hypothetical protein